MEQVELVSSGKVGSTLLCMSFNTEERNRKLFCFLNIHPLRLDRYLSDEARGPEFDPQNHICGCTLIIPDLER